MRDERIVGFSCDRYLPRGEQMPNIPPSLLKCVVFVGYLSNEKEYRFLGSAFWITRTAKDKSGKEHELAYLVTAAHNITKAAKDSSDKQVWLRVNTKTEGAKWEAPSHTGSWATSVDENVDIAVLKIGIDQKWDHIAWRFSGDSVVFDDSLDTIDTGDRKVELGDELVFAGLFHPHEGKERNIPLVRIGHVSALRWEPVLSRDNRPMDLYLVESHSIGGLSGAPVFVDIITAKRALPPTSGYSAGAYDPHSVTKFKLFGVVHGHFGIEDILEDALTPPKTKKRVKRKTKAQEESINFGISMVIPAEKVAEIIQRFAKEEEVELDMREKEKLVYVIPDTLPSPNISFQQTTLSPSRRWAFATSARRRFPSDTRH
jgi:hypothetical protein